MSFFARQSFSDAFVVAWRLLGVLQPVIQTAALLITATISWVAIESTSKTMDNNQRPSTTKLTLYSSDAVGALIATLTHRAAHYQKQPVLRLPWLLFTFRGMLFCQGPSILNLAQSMLLVDWGPGLAGLAFLLIYLTVYCEQTAVWLQEAQSFLADRPEATLLQLLGRKTCAGYLRFCRYPM